VTITFRLDDLRGPEIAALLQEHVDDMHTHSPPDHVHALDLEALRAPEISFWSAWDGNNLAGCGALRAMASKQGEIKSMRTAKGYLRRGVAANLLKHIIIEAQQRGYRRLNLETGTMAAFLPARLLYERHGFVFCPPFGDYTDNSYSCCMTLNLEA
jgi:putative acetyltransferase